MISLELFMAGALLLALTFYALMAGADFGAGVWHLAARGPQREQQRELIHHAIGPIWEANHVWLILAVTILFSAFPYAFALVTTVLHVPLTLMLIGIVLRGSAFAFRNYDVQEDSVHYQWDWVFALSSLITPVLSGITIGAITSGGVRVVEGDAVATFFFSWMAPFPFAVGLFSLALFAFLASAYLIVETDDENLRSVFRRRALFSLVIVAGLAVLVLLLAEKRAPEIPEELTYRLWGRIVVVLAGLLWVATFLLLWNRRFRVARYSAAGMVAMILWGWALGQFPVLVEPSLTIYNAAAPTPTLQFLFWALISGGLLLFPSLAYLYRIFKR